MVTSGVPTASMWVPKGPNKGVGAAGTTLRWPLLPCKCCPVQMKVPEGSGPAEPGVQPCGDATWMLVPVTEGTPWEERAARTLDKSMLI